jgi:predicted ester cyclase
VESFNTRNFAICDTIVAETYTEHALAPFGKEEPGPVAGPEHMRATIHWLIKQFPDIHFEIEDMIAEGDLVACRIRSEGTNSGALNGVIPATGRSFSAAQTHWFRIGEGKLREQWATRDDLSVMVQLGVIPRPGPPQ